ncbi:MAG: type IV secretion system DNA-binding domain-containing protein [Parcubacteria group bacterium]
MPSGLTMLAETNFRGEKKKFGIRDDDRRRHVYVIGKTGMGKSVLLENMAYSDIINGKGICYVDPHGDSAELLIDCIPNSRINDVIYFNPADIDFPIAFNVLERVEPKNRHLVASGLIGVFKKIWADSWGPRLEYLLRNTILALLDYEGSTLLGVNRMLIDKEYRKKVIAKIQNPVVKAFWVDEYTKYSQQFMVEAISPIQNKVGQFLSTGLIRNIVGQVTSTINIRKIMDEGKIFILNLSKGRVGEDASSLLGAMMITKLQLAAMSRVDIPEEERKDFYLYVDEFQNFATESFANILSEARKYKLNLTLGHQYVGQLEIGGNTVVRDAIFGNVGTIILFRIGAGDAEFLVKEFTPRFVEDDLVNLPKYNVYMKLMINGVSSDPFSARTLPPISRRSGNAEKIISISRERYANAREIVEDKIARWTGVETEEMMDKLEKELAQKNAANIIDKKIDFLASQKGDYQKEEGIKEAKEDNDELENEKEEPRREFARREREESDYESAERKTDEVVQIVKCTGCGQKTKINFVPDPKRPVFCKECLKEYRRKQAKEQLEKEQRGGGGYGASSRPSYSKPATPSKDISLNDLRNQDVKNLCK